MRFDTQERMPGMVGPAIGMHRMVDSVNSEGPAAVQHAHQVEHAVVVALFL